MVATRDLVVALVVMMTLAEMIVAEWTCAAELRGTGDGCDCGCGELDPDCETGVAQGSVSRCHEGADAYYVPLSDNHVCDFASDTCVTTNDCSVLNRYEGDESGTCGPCYAAYESATPTGTCRFALVAEDFVQNEVNPFENVNLRFGSSINLVDLNGDGALDLVAVGSGTLASAADGIFRVWTNTGTSSAPNFATDPVAANSSPLENLSRKIQFQPRAAFGDADGDGRPDMAILHSSNPAFGNDADGVNAIGINLFLYIYDEDGQTFDEFDAGDAPHPLQELASFSRVSALALYDFTGDGLLDIVAVLSGVTLAFFPNVGSSSSPLWQERATSRVALSLAAQSIQVEDLDRDGKSDILLMGALGDLRVVFNEGDAQSPIFTPDVDSGKVLSMPDMPTCAESLDEGCPSSIAFGNMYGAAEPSIFVAIQGSAALDPEIRRFTRGSPPPTWTRLDGVANPLAEFTKNALSSPTLVDIDNDGDTDVVVGYDVLVPGARNAKLALLRNDGHEGFKEVHGALDPFADIVIEDIWDNFATHASFHDFDGDGDLDMVVTDMSVTTRALVRTFENVNGSFVELPSEENVFPDGTIIGGKTVQFVNLDGSDTVQAYVAGTATPFLRVASRGFRHSRSAGGRLGQFIEMSTPAFDLSQALSLLRAANSGDNDIYPVIDFGDVDGDGDLDLFIAIRAGPILVWENTGTPVDPEFTDANNRMTITTLAENSFARTQLAVGDFDGDGDADILVGLNTGNFELLLNTQVECGSACTLGRGQCVVSASVDSTAETCENLSELLALSQELVDASDAIGRCYCGAQYDGPACERCADGRYGENCEMTCPLRATTASMPGVRVYPDLAIFEDCVCKATFEMVDGECTCPAGYALDEVRDVCIACPRGSYKSEAGFDSCTACPLGKYADTSVAAADGAIEVVIGATSSSMCGCKSGFERDGDSCTCGAGRELDAASEVCVQCAVSFFKAQAGLDAACLKCPERSTTFSVGQSACEPELCPAGQFRKTTGASCEDCPKGEYRGADALNSCTRCPDLRPQTNTTGSTSVDDCLTQAGSLAIPGSKEIVTCEAVPKLKISAECKTPGISILNVPIKKHYWRIGPSIDVRKCPNSVSCEPPHGKTGRRLQLQTSSACNQSAGECDQYCSEFHTGTLCASCIEGYAKNRVFRCEECDDTRKKADIGRFVGWIILASIIVVAPAAYVYIFSVPKTKDSDSERPPSTKCSFSRCCSISRCVRSVSDVFEKCPGSGVVKILWHAMRFKAFIFIKFAQIVVQVGIIVGITGTGGSMAEFLLNLNLGALLEVVPVGCIFKIDLNWTVLITTLWPILSGLCIVIAVLLRRWQSGDSVRAYEKAVTAFTELLIFIYPGISFTIFSVFVPDEIATVYIPDGANATGMDMSPFRALQRDPTINFDDSSSAAWRVYAGIMVLVYPIGVPLLIALGFHYAKRADNAPAANRVGPRATSHGPTWSIPELLAEAVRRLKRPYREEMKWYACVELLQRLILTSGFLLMQVGSLEDAATFLVAWNILFVIVLTFFMPYQGIEDNVFAFFSNVLLCAFALGVQRVNEIDIILGRRNPLVIGVIFAEFVLFVCISMHDAITDKGDDSSDGTPSTTSSPQEQPSNGASGMSFGLPGDLDELGINDQYLVSPNRHRAPPNSPRAVAGNVVVSSGRSPTRSPSPPRTTWPASGNVVVPIATSSKTEVIEDDADSMDVSLDIQPKLPVTTSLIHESEVVDDQNEHEEEKETSESSDAGSDAGSGGNNGVAALPANVTAPPADVTAPPAQVTAPPAQVTTQVVVGSVPTSSGSENNGPNNTTSGTPSSAEGTSMPRPSSFAAEAEKKR